MDEKGRGTTNNREHEEKVGLKNTPSLIITSTPTQRQTKISYENIVYFRRYNESEEELIEAVRKRPILWNPGIGKGEYSNRNKKADAWADVADEIGARGIYRT